MQSRSRIQEQLLYLYTKKIVLLPTIPQSSTFAIIYRARCPLSCHLLNLTATCVLILDRMGIRFLAQMGRFGFLSLQYRKAC